MANDAFQNLYDEAPATSGKFEDLYSATTPPVETQASGDFESLYGPVDDGTSFLGGAGEILKRAPVQTLAGLYTAAGDAIAPTGLAPNIGMNILKGARTGPGTAVVEGVTSLAEIARRKALDVFGSDNLKATGQELTRQGMQVGKLAEEDVRAAIPKDLGILGQAGLSAVSSVAQMTPWLMAARFGGTKVSPEFLRAGGLSQFAGMNFGQSYNEARNAGVDPEIALRHALGASSAEALGEYFGLGTLLKGGKNWFGKFLLQEVGGENLTTIAQSLSEKAYYNEKKWTDPAEIAHDLAVTTLGAGMGASAMKGLDASLSVFQKERKHQEFEDTQAGKDLREILSQLGQTPEDTVAEKPSLVPQTPQEEALAAVQEKQLKGDFANVPASPEGVLFGQSLNERLGTGGEVQDEGQVSSYVQQKREERAALFPSEGTPHSQRRIVAASDPRVIGLTLEQAGPLQPGSIVAIREEGQEDVHPTEVYAMLTEDLKGWMKKYAPTARVVLNLEQFAEKNRNATFGLHQLGFTQGMDGEVQPYHVITPRELPAFAKYQNSDAKTALGLLGGLSHEFGHLVRWEGFRNGIAEVHGQAFATKISQAIEEGTITPEQMAEFAAKSPEEAALVQDWQERRARLLDGTMTADQFMEEWAGLRKVGESVGRNLPRDKSLYEWKKNRLSLHGIPEEGASAAELLVGKRDSNGQFSARQMKELKRFAKFDEYMAEQFTRYSYVKGDILRSKFGKFFADMMQRLKSLFVDLKTAKGQNGERIIQPGETFATWMDKQTLRAKGMQKGTTGRLKLSKEVLAAQKQASIDRLEQLKAEEAAAAAAVPEGPKSQGVSDLTALLESLRGKADPETAPAKVAEKVKQEKKAAKPKKVKQPPVVPVAETPPEVALSVKEVKQRYKELIDDTYPEGSDSENADDSRRYEALTALLERGELAKLELWLNKVRSERDHGDRDYTSRVLSRLPNKEKIKTATLELTMKQKDVRAVEQQFWADFAQQHPNGFSWQEAQQALQNRITQLEPVRIQENKINQVEKLGQPKFLTVAPSQQIVASTDVTVMWRGPIAMPESMSSQHFDDPRYVSHSRYLDDGTVRNVIEQQSDAFQSKDRGGYGEGATVAQTETVARMTERLQALEQIRQAVQTYAEVPAELEGLGIPGALAKQYPGLAQKAFGETAASGAIDGTTKEILATVARYEKAAQDVRRKAESTAAVKQQQAEAASPDLTFWEKWWWQQQIRDNVTLALEDGKTKLRFRSAETAAYMEGWPIRNLLNEFVDRKLATYKADNGVLVVAYANPYPDFWKDGPVVTASGEVQVYGDLTQEPLIDLETDQGRFQLREGSTLYNDVVRALQAQKTPVTYGKNQGIFDRYAKDIPAYLKKNFGAVPVVAYGQTWWEVDLNQAHPEADMAWDKDFENPLQPPKAGIVLTEQAGLSEQDARNPGVVEAARIAWEKLRFKSPYWQKFAGETKAVGNDGLPVKVWYGQGSRVPVAGEVPAMLFTTNPDNIRTPAIGDRRKGPKFPQVQGFYLNLKNPLELDYGWGHLDEQQLTDMIAEAVVNGHDGLILRHVSDPLDSTVYVTLSPEQAAMEADIPVRDETDQMHWDAESDQQQSTRGFGKLLQNFGNRAWMRANNARAKGVDYLIQLQQVAASQPDDPALHTFMQVKWEGERLKNQLQYKANETVKSMLNAFGSSRASVESLKKIFELEQAEQVMLGELVGLDRAGQVVQDANRGNASQVQTWEVRETLALREAVAAQGIDPTTEAGRRVIQHYLDTRNTFQIQFNGLANALWKNALRKYSGAPQLLQREYLTIEKLHKELRTQPFVPQGHFGKYVVIVQKDLGPQGPGKQRYVPVMRQHFEDVADFNQAYKKFQAEAASVPGLRVQSRVLEDQEGMPIQLPRELLETLGQTGLFSENQMAALAELLVSAKYDKIADRFKKIGANLPGGSPDFVRTFAAFTWHNSNYIWKMQFGPALRAAVGVARSRVRELERSEDFSPEEKLKLVQRQRRNIGLMDKAADYMLNPKGELQTLRYWATMAYLAANLSTAAFNLSTQINYWAAISTEYGELNGSKLYFQSLKDTASIPWWQAQLDSPNVSREEKQRIANIKWAYEKAVKDGLLDQSYAYFLAGQANTGGVLSSTATTAVGKLAHSTMELGMVPFRTIERGNRLSTFLGYFNAELSVGTLPLVAYSLAAEKVDLLQNAYDAANKPELLRGKKSIFFMFASYTQFIQWTMAGGYERGARATARSQGRTPPSVWHGTTMKLWIIYGLLGGLLGLPGAQNLLDLVKWAWRKFFGSANVEVELRRYMKDIGVDADWILHGALHDIGGFDVSGKFGLGRILPGTDLLNRNFQDPFTGLGQATLQMAGPAGGIAADGLRMLGKFSQGDWKGGFKEFPGVIGSVSKAEDAYVNQENTPTYGVTTNTGERMTWDEKRKEFRDLTTKELFGMAIGIQPTIISQNRQAHYAAKGEEIYWNTRRGDLLDKLYRAKRTGDTELQKEVDKDIERMNAEAPHPSLRITGKDKVQSWKGRRNRAHKEEVMGLIGRRGRALGADIRDIYREE